MGTVVIAFIIVGWGISLGEGLVRIEDHMRNTNEVEVTEPTDWYDMQDIEEEMPSDQWDTPEIDELTWADNKERAS